MKFIIILYMCSIATGKCPTSSITALEFDSHYDCVVNGYKAAHNTFINLKELEEFEKDYINEKRIVVKFECKKLQGV